jgi:hypothetical protein
MIGLVEGALDRRWLGDPPFDMLAKHVSGDSRGPGFAVFHGGETVEIDDAFGSPQPIQNLEKLVIVTATNVRHHPRFAGKTHHKNRLGNLRHSVGDLPGETLDRDENESEHPGPTLRGSTRAEDGDDTLVEKPPDPGSDRRLR